MKFDLSVTKRNELWSYVSHKLEKFCKNIESIDVAGNPTRMDAQSELISDFNHERDATEALDSVINGLTKYAVHTPHPKYFRMFNPRPNFRSVLADALSASFNPQLAAWSHAPYAVEVEHLLIQEFGMKFGYDSGSIDGVFATGGQEAHITGVQCALNFKYKDFEKLGLRSLYKTPIIYCSKSSHHATIKAAKIAGLGRESVKYIDVNQSQEMIAEDLEKQIIRDIEEGLEPFFVFATMGTTGAGAIDPVNEIADLAVKYDLWVHADAAYGGAVVLTNEYKHLINGIERADSITFDAHKWLSVPMATSMFLTRHTNIMGLAFGISANFMPDDEDEIDRLSSYTHSIQWSRRFIGLKLYLPLLVFGWDGFSETISHQIKMGKLLKSKLLDSNWEILNDSSLPIVCFIDSRFSGNENFAKFVYESFLQTGDAWIINYPYGSKFSLRAGITNYATDEKHLDELVSSLNRKRTEYLDHLKFPEGNKEVEKMVKPKHSTVPKVPDFSLGIKVRLGSLLIFYLVISGKDVQAQSAKDVINATKIDQAILIDGLINEPVWETIAPLEVKQKVPNSGASPTQRTEIRLAYDDQYLYLSGRMYDSEPHKINSNSKKRDDFTENTEWCGLLIDSFNDRENALGFYVTPTGSRLDMALSNDAQGPSAFNLSWNTFWKGASTIDSTGWFAEIQIPFSSLPFEVIDGEVTMGITTWRYLARNDETDIYPTIKISDGSSFRPSLTQKFVFREVETRKPVWFTPYVLLGRINSFQPRTEEEYPSEKKYKTEIGGDVKIAFGSNTSLDLTINTDFAQVEVDDQQVNLTRLNLFFPEKRLFFQERSSLFEFNFGTYDKAFHSRRIGIIDGQQTRIFGGARAYGRYGTFESGFLNMQTGPLADLDSENFTVFRARKRVFNENSTLGMIVTNRTNLGNKYNTLYGLDGTIKYHKSNFVSVRWAQTFNDDQENNLFNLNQTKYFLEFTKRSQDGFTYTVNYGRSGKNYNPGIGFEHRRDFKQLNHTFNYNFFPNKESKISQHGPYFSGGLTWGNSHGQLESRNSSIGYNFLTKLGWTYDIKIQLDQERLFQPLNLPGDLEIQTNNYHFTSAFGSIISNSANRLAYSAGVGFGEFYNGTKTEFRIAPFINITKDFIAEGSYTVNRLLFNDQTTHVQLSQLKLLYTFSTKLTLNSFIQHHSVNQMITGSIRFRYNPKEGTDFFCVVNGDLNQNRMRNDLFLPVSNQTTIFLKYSHTLQF